MRWNYHGVISRLTAPPHGSLRLSRRPVPGRRPTLTPPPPAAVVTEAGRVSAFRSVCESGGEEALSRMGRLMTESHASCRDQYECSHELLDAICRLADGVAYGARLTGAG